MKIFLENTEIGFIETALGVGLDRLYYDISRTVLPENILYVTKLYVDPKFRRMGYGRMLVEKLKKYAVDGKFICLDAIPLEDDILEESLVKLYTSCGFRKAKGLLAFVYGGDL